MADRIPFRLSAPLSLAAFVASALLPACSDDGPAGPGPDPGERVLAIGVARNDLSPADRLEGFLAFFYDLDEGALLEADVAVDQTALATVIEPGVVEGPVYVGGGTVEPGAGYRLSATVTTGSGPVEVTSQEVFPPPPPVVEIPETHSVGQPLVVQWEPVTGATGISLSAGSGYDADLPATATSATIPATAFEGLEPGETIEIEVTAYDTFYVSLSAGISGLQDAEAFAARFAGVDNVEGAEGAFGAATTVGAIVTLE